MGEAPFAEEGGGRGGGRLHGQNYGILLVPLTSLTFASLPTDLRAAQDRGVHLPHSFLHQHRGGAMGRCRHLQDQEELYLPAGHEVGEFWGLTKGPTQDGRGDGWC